MMKLNRSKIILFCCCSILGFLVLSCKKQSNVDLVLNSAGNNRKELQSVLEYYSKNANDSLKYRAACFLIENMWNKFTTTNPILDTLEANFCSRLTTIEGINYKYSTYTNSRIWLARVEGTWLEALKSYEGKALQTHKRISDIESIRADFLIENIDNAFEAWTYPWARHLSFEQFCEYVLPYRFGDEPLESWRPYLMSRYRWVVDSLENKTDPIEVCRLINDDIASWFYFDGMFNEYSRALPLSVLLEAKAGGCPQQALLASFAMRAMGLAISNEFIPHWGDRSQGHHFSSVLSSEGRFIDFLGGELPPGKNEIRNKASKIFRETFFIHPKSVWKNISNNELKSILSQSVDVTSDYIPSSTVSIDLPNDFSAQEAYLFVFNNTNWVPVMVADIEGKKAIFRDMGRQIVYLPIFLNDLGTQQMGTPFILHQSGEVEPIVADATKKQSIILDRKYPLQQRMVNFSKNMVGGKFQGANFSDFRDATDLFTIKDTPKPLLTFYPVEEEGQYRYLRYLFPPAIVDEHSGDVSEIGFQGFLANRDSIQYLMGDYIGSPELSAYHFEQLFDKKFDNHITLDVADTIVANYPERSIAVSSTQKSVWVGLDLKKKYHVTDVAYCPRNDMNNLYEYCIYELFYWDHTWKSLGTKKPTHNVLTYDRIPSDALFLLRNLTEGREERIFTYDDEKVIFW